MTQMTTPARAVVAATRPGRPAAVPPGSVCATVLVRDELVRRGLLEVLRAQSSIRVDGGCGAPGDVAQLDRIAEDRLVDLVVAEVDPSGDPRAVGVLDVSAVLEAKRRHPGLGVVLLAQDLAEPEVLAAVAGGVDGLVWRASPVEDLVTVVEQVGRGCPALDRHFTGVLIRALRSQAERHGAALTAREREVLSLVALGQRNPTVARSLFISESTVKFHLRNITEKLGASSRAEVVSMAVRLGLA